MDKKYNTLIAIGIITIVIVVIVYYAYTSSPAYRAQKASEEFQKNMQEWGEGIEDNFNKAGTKIIKDWQDYWSGIIHT